MHGVEKRIVYIVRSNTDPSRHYVGITNDLTRSVKVDDDHRWPRSPRYPGMPWEPKAAFDAVAEWYGR